MPNDPIPTPAPLANDSGLDVSFATLFGGGQPDILPTTSAPTTPETPQVASPSDPAPVQQADQQTPSTSQSLPQAFELKTKTGTVYKSIEDAVSGIEHKDTLISQLRQFAVERTGIDPLTGQPVAQQPQFPSQPQLQPQGNGQVQQPKGYVNNPQQYFQDLYQAYANNDPNAYFATQQRLIEEQTQAQYAPYIGMLMEQSKTSAVAKVSNELPGFDKFHNSNSFKETLQAHPSLANAIAVSESNAQYRHQLEDLYKMSFQLHQARTLPELIKQQQAAIPPQQPVRPTTQQTQLSPPQTITVPRNPNLTDANQRKAVIEAFEQSGKADVTWRK